MFSIKNSTKSVLLCGPTDLTRTILFETAIHWAEEGRRVVYIAPAPLTSIPAKYHDRGKIDPHIFEMMKFMYMKSYETLMEQLVDLHTFATLPAVLLIDSLHTYTHNNIKEQQDMHIARICAIIHDSMNACSRLHKSQVYICASVSSKNLNLHPYSLFFDSIWSLKRENQEEFDMRQILGDPKKHNIFKYKKFSDGTLILARILRKSGNDN